MYHIPLETDEMLTSPPREKTVEKKGRMQLVASHIRRTTLEAVNILIGYDWAFGLIGLINRRIHFIESVFLVYPANKEYALAYVYPYRLPRVEWKPWPCGLLWQNGRLSVMFCVSATNGQYADAANLENLRRVSARMEKLRQLLGARRKTFAGILPGILLGKRIIRDAPEADLTATAVWQAIEEIKANESLQADTPIIVLGGKGFIGRRLVRMLDQSIVYSLDSADGQNKKDWPRQFNAKRVIVVNITLNKAIEEYVEVMRPGTVVINEVYPEPNLDILSKLSGKKCHCYHVVGVKAQAFPPFPLAYRGAIPCCAAWPSNKMRVVVRKLV